MAAGKPSSKLGEDSCFGVIHNLPGNPGRRGLGNLLVSDKPGQQSALSVFDLVPGKYDEKNLKEAQWATKGK